MRLAKTLILICIFLIFVSTSFAQGRPFDLSENLMKPEDITDMQLSHAEERLNRLTSKAIRTFRPIINYDDGDINSSMEGALMGYILPGSIAYEISMDHDYIVWYNDSQRGKVNPTQYLRGNNSYIVIFNGVKYENSNLHVGLYSDVWTHPIYANGVYEAHNMTNFSTILTDVSGNGNNATIINDPSFINDGTTDIIVFDGIDDHVETTFLTTHLSDNFTISVWFNSAVGVVNQALWGTQHTGGNDFFLFIDTDSTLLATYKVNTVQHIVSSTSTYNDGNWHFVTVMVELTKNITMIIDNNTETVVNFVGNTALSTPHELMFGAWSNGGAGGAFIEANMTQFVIWNGTKNASWQQFVYEQGRGYQFDLGNPISIQLVNISPASPFDNQDITVTTNVTNAVNGTLNCSNDTGVIQSTFIDNIGFNTTTVSNALYATGENITCTLYAVNGTNTANLASNTVLINTSVSPISITAVNMTPVPMFWDTNNLTCNFNYTGVDPFYNYSVKWYKNGAITSTQDYCYQETANVSNSCGAKSTGTYSCDISDWENCVNLFDGNYSSRDRRNFVFGIALAYINYTKPDLATKDSLWNYKGYPSSGDGENYTLPLSCWDAYPDRLMFRLQSTRGGVPLNRGACYNGTDWIEFVDNNGGGNPDYEYFYEESMHWRIGNKLNNSEYDIYDNITCELTAFNGTYNSSLNSSTLQIIGARLFNVNITPTFTLYNNTATCNQYSDHTSNVTYKWYSNNVSIANATTNSLFLLPYTNTNILCEVNASPYFNASNIQNSSNAIFVTPPNLYFLNLSNFSSIYEQDLLCDILVNNSNLTTIEWIVNNTVAKYTNSTAFNVSDYTTSHLGQEIYCRVNVSVEGGYYFISNMSNNVTIGQRINFTSNNTITGTEIENFSISYSAGTFTAVGKSLIIYNYNQSEIYTFSHPDFANSTANLTTNITYQAYNFNVTTANSINFYFRKATDHTLINDDNLSVILLSDDIAELNYNFTADNGTYFIDGVESGSYIVSVSGSLYSQTIKNIVVVNKTTQTVTIFLYNTSTTKVTYTVLSNLGDKLEGAIVQTLQNFDGNWNVVSECNTNSVGECSINLFANQWVHYYVFYQDLLTPKFVTESAEFLDYTERTPFIINLAQQQLNEYFNYDDVVILNFTATNVSNNFTFRLQATYDATVDNVCLDVYEANGSTVCYQCLNGSGNIVFCDALLENKTYYADANSVINEKSYNLAQIVVDLRRTIPILGKQGVFLAFLITLFCGCLGLFMGGSLETNIGLVVGVIISTLFGFVALSWSSIVILIIIAIAIGIRRFERGR